MHNTFRRRIAFILLATIAIWAFLWYTNDLVDKLNQSSRKDCETIARLWAGVQYPLSFIGNSSGLLSCTACGHPEARSNTALESDSLFCPSCSETRLFIHTSRLLPDERDDIIASTRRLFAELVNRLDFPTIFADIDSVPQIVNGQVVSGYPSERLIELRKSMKLLSEQNNPIPMCFQGDTIGYLFYGSSPLNTEMRLIPFLELCLLLLVAVVVFMFLRSEISRDKSMSWVGFARETAHQISTPLSSLMGWIELLKDDQALSDNKDLAEALFHMDADVERLTSIAQRYGQMGRPPRPKPVSIESTVSGIVNYFNARKGLLGHGVVLEMIPGEQNLFVNGNSVLMGWVIENLIKNAVASCAGNPMGGKVIVSYGYSGRGSAEAEILVSDNGSGIPYSDQGKIFTAGFTTRKGGWGLGLSLAKRIVEEYHKGTIRLLSSTPEIGTTFSILLPLTRGGESDNHSLGR